MPMISNLTTLPQSQMVEIPLGGLVLKGEMTLLPNQPGLVVFVHGSGSSHLSSRNRAVANHLNETGFSTLLFDLLTLEEEKADAITKAYRFNIRLLATRLSQVTDWLLAQYPETKLGYFGASTGAAAALIAAAENPDKVSAIVARGGRPDLANTNLRLVQTPTLLLVGSKDAEVLRLNEWALGNLNCPSQLTVIPEATHLFEEPGALEQVADLAANWFSQYLSPASGSCSI